MPYIVNVTDAPYETIPDPLRDRSEEKQLEDEFKRHRIERQEAALELFMKPSRNSESS